MTEMFSNRYNEYIVFVKISHCVLRTQCAFVGHLYVFGGETVEVASTYPRGQQNPHSANHFASNFEKLTDKWAIEGEIPQRFSYASGQASGS